MAEIVNLRQARKKKARARKDTEASTNRTKHGISKATRRVADVERDHQNRSTDAKKLDPER